MLHNSSSKCHKEIDIIQTTVKTFIISPHFVFKTHLLSIIVGRLDLFGTFNYLHELQILVLLFIH